MEILIVDCAKLGRRSEKNIHTSGSELNRTQIRKCIRLKGEVIMKRISIIILSIIAITITTTYVIYNIYIRRDITKVSNE